LAYLIEGSVLCVATAEVAEVLYIAERESRSAAAYAEAEDVEAVHLVSPNGGALVWLLSGDLDVV
jgi:hypothetical protein